MRTLRRAVAHLGLRAMNADEAETARSVGENVQDEGVRTVAQHGIPPEGTRDAVSALTD